MPNQPQPLHAVAGFAAHLREHGFQVGIPEQQAMLTAALRLPLAQHGRIESCWRAIVCANPDSWRRYPELFEHYWYPHRVRGSVRSSGMTRRARSLPEMVQALHQEMEQGGQKPSDAKSLGFADSSAGAGDGENNGQAMGGASSADPLAKRDFGEWLQSDLQRLNQLAEAVAQRVRKRLMRRKEWVSRAQAIDMRRTLRNSLRYGGVPLAPAYRRARRELPKIFILVDVSRSMEIYAQLFLRVARAFCEVVEARAFVFHTRLAEITELLKKRTDRVQEKINAVTFGFGGGTRIATSVNDFVHTHARTALSGRSIVLVFSDGYDTDPPEDLAASLARLNGRGARVYWLHPSQRTHFSTALAQAQHLVRGFIPAHNLESLEKLPGLIH
ncbi:MAG: VWA domain-containing protein [Betaproteobacteria bacterium]|nr:VWA domain-containing protein [Betaproteobacteria bacterium]